jgi:hypothetical protein
VKASGVHHRKFRYLAQILEIPRPHAIGMMELLYSYAQRYVKTGLFTDHSPADLAHECEWTGDPATLVDAMVTAGLLDRLEDGTVAIHDWLEHCPHYILRDLKASGGLPQSWERGEKNPIWNLCRDNVEQCCDFVVTCHDSPTSSPSPSPSTTTPRQAAKPPAPAGPRLDGYALIDIPPDFREDAAFMATLADWCACRREIGKTISKTSAGRQMAKLRRMGVADATASLEQSMANGWTGVFEPRTTGPPGSRTKRTPEDYLRLAGGTDDPE